MASVTFCKASDNNKQLGFPLCVMLADPIFQGLAVSLIFGEIAATILSRFAVRVLYYWIVGKGRVSAVHAE